MVGTKPILLKQSYHRTGAECYYGVKSTCKQIFYIFFTLEKSLKLSHWQAKSRHRVIVDRHGQS